MTVFLRFLFCFLVLSLGPMAWWQRHGWVVHRVIPTSGIAKHEGAAYSVPVRLYPFTRRLTDSLDRHETSDLRLFEGAKELGPGHTLGDTVAAQGGGLFDDWEGAVVMSTPDNRDPRTTGFVYSASYRAFPGWDAPAALVAACALSALAAADGWRLFTLRPRRRTANRNAAQIRDIALTSALYGLAVAVLLLAFHGVGIHATLRPGSMEPFGGFAFRAPLASPPPLFVALSDDVPGGSRSELSLAENGRPLGPPQAPHAVVRSSGRGAYSHWAGGVVFSTTDGEDPRIDGRRYRADYRIFLIPSVAFPILVLAIGTAMFRLFRGVGSTARIAPPVASLGRFPRNAATLFRPGSLFRVGGYALVYTLALMLLYGALLARKNDTGGFKINFEYKVF